MGRDRSVGEKELVVMLFLERAAFFHECGGGGRGDIEVLVDVFVLGGVCGVIGVLSVHFAVTGWSFERSLNHPVGVGQLELHTLRGITTDSLHAHFVCGRKKKVCVG